MAGRYPSTLFHFTKTKEALFGILSNNFKVSYAVEEIEGDGKSRTFAAPMVSFCDLRLSEVASHMATYGDYGIGLAKEWAVKRGLNPVAYWNAEARLINNLFQNVEDFYKDVRSENDYTKSLTMEKRYNDSIDIYRFIKNYEGRLERRGHDPVEKFRFADEREWRYVPSIDAVWPPFVDSKSINERGKEFWNQTIDHRLEFEPDDIRYIIVANEDERMAVIEHIKGGTEKDKKYGDAAVVRLTSRILTAQQIRDDV